MSELTDKQAELASIQKARNSGVLMVRHGDVMTTFRSLAEMDKIIASLTAEIAKLADTAQVRQYRFIPHKGL